MIGKRVQKLLERPLYFRKLQRFIALSHKTFAIIEQLVHLHLCIMSNHLFSSATDCAISDQLRTVMDATSDAMFLIHRPSMSFLDVNHSACRLLGYSRNELLSMEPSILSGCPREYHEKIYDGLINGSMPATAAGETLKSKTGDLLTVEVQRFAQPSDEGWIIVVVARDMSENQRTDTMIAQANAELARLSLELQMVREEERNNLATRLHGDLGQLLAALRINLSLLQQQLPDAKECSQALQNIDKLVVSSITSLRRISAELRPQGIAEGKLYSALHQLTQETSERSGLQCVLLADESDLYLDESRSTMVYRMLHDAITNVVPRAGASAMELACRRQHDHLVLTVRSDAAGKCLGVDGAVPAYRLASLRERVRLVMGRMEVSGSSEKDYCLTITMPLNSI
jgi:PAS domain S-box-containing protein